MDKKEKKDRIVGATFSIALHSILLILFTILLASGGKESPEQEIGFELEVGNSFQASGQTTEEVEQIQEEVSQEEVVEEEIQEEQQVEAVEEEVSTPIESTVETETATEDEIRQQPVEEEVKEEVEKEAKEPTPELNPNALYKKTDKGKGDDEKGDKDKGTEEGKLDDRALYGKQGGGSGPQLNLAGWMWDRPPRPQDTSNETGRIVFNITIDQNGDIISLTTKEKTVSSTVERIYKEAVQNTTFSPISNNAVPSRTSGEITFIIRSK